MFNKHTHVAVFVCGGKDAVVLLLSLDMNKASRFRICSLLGSHIPLRGLWMSIHFDREQI